MEKLLDLLKKQDLEKNKIVKIKKGQILYKEDEKCDCVCIVIKGLIKISSTSFEGNEIIFNILKVDEIFGNNLIFSDEPYYKGDVIACIDSEVVVIEKKELISLLQNNEEFLQKYLSIQSNFGKMLNTRIKLLSFDLMEERFLYFLHVNNGQIRFKNVTILASELGMKRETLSRLISKLQKEKVILRIKNLIKQL